LLWSNNVALAPIDRCSAIKSVWYKQMITGYYRDRI